MKYLHLIGVIPLKKFTKIAFSIFLSFPATFKYFYGGNGKIKHYVHRGNLPSHVALCSPLQQMYMNKKAAKQYCEIELAAADPLQ